MSVPPPRPPAMAVAWQLLAWLTVAGLWIAVTIAAVEAIQLIYAVLWHPDPRRFGFWFNFASDFAGMNLHVAACWAAAALLARQRQRPQTSAR